MYSLGFTFLGVVMLLVCAIVVRKKERKRELIARRLLGKLS